MFDFTKTTTILEFKWNEFGLLVDYVLVTNVLLLWNDNIVIPVNVLDRFAHRTDGWRQSAAEDRPTVSANLLAVGSPGAHVHQLPGRTHEYGRKMETKDRLWSGRSRVTVSVFLSCAIHGLGQVPWIFRPGNDSSQSKF